NGDDPGEAAFPQANDGAYAVELTVVATTISGPRMTVMIKVDAAVQVVGGVATVEQGDPVAIPKNTPWTAGVLAYGAVFVVQFQPGATLVNARIVATSRFTQVWPPLIP